MQKSLRDNAALWMRTALDAVRYPVVVRPLISSLAPGGAPHQVLFICPEFEPGGGERVALNIARFSYKQRFSFHAIATDRAQHRWRDRFEKTFEQAIVPAPWRLSPKGYTRFVSDLIRQLKIDLLLFYHNEPTFQTLPEIKRLFPDLRVVDITHYAYDTGWFQKTLESIPLLDARVAISQSIAGHLKALYEAQGIDTDFQERIHCLYNGIDIQNIQESVKRGKETARIYNPDTEPLIAWIGRFDPVKQPRRFVDVAAKVLESHPNCRFVMAGDGEELPAVEVLIAEHGIQDRFRLPGMLREEKVAALLDRASALVVTSDSEGIPVVILEAMALGAPIVSTDCGGISEVIKDRETGLLASLGANVVEDLARATSSLIEDKAFANALSDKARILVYQQFTVEAMAGRYGELFEEVLGGRSMR